jgi:hypothetical protein
MMVHRYPLKTKIVPITPATTSEPMDSSFFLKLILENQREQKSSSQ